MYSISAKDKISFMKKILLTLVIGILTTISITAQPDHYNRDTYPEYWAKIDSLIDKAGLPKSALLEVDKLYEKATKEGNPAQQIKCLIFRLKVLDATEETENDFKLKFYEEAYQKAVFPVNVVLASLLGESYENYHRNYRNSVVLKDGGDDNDPQFWSDEKIKETARTYFSASLQADKTKKVLLSDFDELLREAENADGVWTSLYDVLIHRYIAFERRSLANGFDVQKIETERVFAKRSDFLKMDLSQLPLGDAYAVLKMYQDWMRFHQKKKNNIALIQADLDRLEFCKDYSKTYQKKELYLDALRAMLAREQGQDKTEIQYKIAQQLYDESSMYKASYEETESPYKWLRKEALELCNDAIKKWPTSIGAKQCLWLKERITEQTVNVTMLDVVYPKEDFLAKLTYKNVQEVNFRLVKVPFNFDPYNRSQEKIIEDLLAMKVFANYSQQLPNDGDLQEHSVEFRMEALESGRYYLMTSAVNSYTKQDVFVINEFKVSQIAVLNNNNIEGEAFVVNRNTGLPLKDAAMHLYYGNRNGMKKATQILYTDADGYVKYTADRQSRRNAFWVYGSDTLDTHTRMYSYTSNQQAQKRAKTLLFTDRSIYRPGQQVYFKTVSLWNYGKGKTELLIDKKIKISFYDANRQLVEEKELKTNAFGSVNGSFMIPDNGLTGSMSIATSHGGFRKAFRVEAYKRPKFELSFDPVEKSFRPGDKVAVSGKAEAFAGSALDGASYKYTVVRSVGFPFGCYFWRPYFEEKQEIASGKGTLDSEGKFVIHFDALRLEGVGENEKPEYQYKVLVDVTDINGETQSDESSVNVGVVSMRAALAVPAIMDRNSKIDWKISASNLNHTPITTNGRIMIQRLEPLERFKRDRKWALPDNYIMNEAAYEKFFPNDLFREEHKLENRAVEATVYGAAFDTGASDHFYRLKNDWAVGDYKVSFTAIDPYGKEFKKEYYFKLIDSAKGEVPAQEVLCHYANFKSLKPGETAEFYFGNDLRNNHLLFRMEKDGEIYQSNWLRGGKFLKKTFNIDKKHRGNLSYEITGVYKNNVYQYQKTIEVPWADKALQLSYTTFRDKLLPGSKEQWEIKIKGAEGERVETELLLSMYDASLDALNSNTWNQFIYPTSYQKRHLKASGFGLSYRRAYFPGSNERFVEREKPGFKPFNYYSNYNYGYRGVYRADKSMMMANSVEMEDAELAEIVMEDDVADFDSFDDAEETSTSVQKLSPEKAKEVQIRSNLKETVFFYPDLKTDADGNIVFSFTMNEALTKWKLKGYGHSKSMQQVYTEKEVVTQKQLMVQPNPPRFLREGDELVFTSKLSNLSEETLQGTIRLEWLDALSMKKLPGAWNESTTQNFSVDSKRNVKKSWTVKVPDTWTRPVVYRLVAQSDRYSDGEEAAIPVLSKRILLTESVPVYIKGNTTETASIPNLINFNSKTGKHHKLTLELTENPAWYALQAMPYLMEYPHECSEQLFSRFYANSLAERLMSSKPSIQQVFENWKNTDALQSALSKNQELKNILLKETPWVMQAANEKAQKQRLGLLFDFNTMKNNKQRSLRKLKENQLSDGSFPWFKGGKGSEYITRYIVEGFGHLKQMDVVWDDDVDKMLKKAIAYVDGKALSRYRKLEENVAKKKTTWNAQNINQFWIHYMYTRSYFTADFPLTVEHKKVYDYFNSQAVKYWPKFNPYLTGMIGIRMHRDGDSENVKKLTASLKEKAVHTDLGVYWKQNGWYWYQLPIEQQSLLIDFMDLSGESSIVEDGKRWLLSQKRTQHWSTTKGTAAAIHVLLMTGEDWLAEGSPLKVTIGGEKLDTDNKKEAGSAYQKIVWNEDELSNKMGELRIENPNKSPAWAGLYWQYFEDRAAINASDKGPLSLDKKVYVERQTAKGVEMVPVKNDTDVRIGDKLLVRLEISNDQEMSYVHVKDGRASALEPIELLSKHKWNNGLYYYQSIDDAAMHFFIDRMPKGKFVLSYELRVTHEGKYTGGIAEASCMYAPEFSGHTEGRSLEVKP